VPETISDTEETEKTDCDRSVFSLFRKKKQLMPLKQQQQQLFFKIILTKQVPVS